MISLTQSAARSIGRLNNKLRRRIELLSAKKEFSGSQGRTLHFLLSQTDDVFQKVIEYEYGFRPPTASELLKQMEQNWLLTREPVPYDNRLKKIILTDKALQYQQQVVADLTGLEETLIRDIPEEKMAVFFEVIGKMMENLSE